MGSQHTAFIAETRQNIIDAAGLRPRMGALGFTAIYAAKVHENIRSGNTGGASPSGKSYREGSYSTVGQWKFLETPLKETKRIMHIIRSHIK